VWRWWCPGVGPIPLAVAKEEVPLARQVMRGLGRPQWLGDQPPRRAFVFGSGGAVW
jgi:hypothetical protein